MMNLADFLLARIAEDEVAVGSLSEYGGRTGIPGRCKESRRAEGWDWIETSDWDDGYRLATTADRTRAECEAKRKIVGLWNLQLTVPEPEYGLAGGEPLGGQGAEVYYDALKALALPYAGHPDFREEWKL